MGEVALLLVAAMVMVVGLAFLAALIGAAVLVATYLMVKLFQAIGEADRLQNARMAEVWAEAATEQSWTQLGRFEYEGVTAGGTRFTARRRQEYRPHGTGGTWERWVEVRVPDVAPPGTITAQQLLHLTRDRTVGAPAFDKSAFVRVAEAQVPRFGHRFQAAWLAATRARVHPSVRKGEVVVKLDRWTVDPDDLRGLADHAEALADAIGDGPLEQVLVAELHGAEAEAYRVRCLRQLAEVAPDLAAAQAEGLTECGVRVLEVEALGLLGHLDALLDQVGDPELPLKTRERMVRRVVDQGDAGQVALVLRAAASDLLSGQLEALFEHLTEAPRAGASAGLVAASDGLDARPESLRSKVGAQWCRALAAQSTPAPGTEEALTRQLEHEDVELAIAAATALRVVGTASSVPALSARADRVGLLGSQRVAAACRQAISAIQGRVTGGAGDLSVVATVPEEGALSVARARRPGALSEGG